jgi:UDP-N-acetylmuramyl pentapeptide phosphotransferase/UDP-N-acetylglucosamine-1-phosphate transferase
MNESPRSFASRIVALLLACLAAIIGFLAFNVVDGVFGLALAILGLAACIAVTVFVVRRAPPPEEEPDA